jgi:quercetin dioxygenase-like cupin family protein
MKSALRWLLVGIALASGTALHADPSPAPDPEDQPIIDAYKKSPTSPDALYDYTFLMIRLERYSEAHHVLDDWKKVSPKDNRIPLLTDLLTQEEKEPDPQKKAKIAGEFGMKQLEAITKKLGSIPSAITAPPSADDGTKVVQLFTQTMPPLPYRVAQVITVEYAPGKGSPKHRHDMAVLAYVLKGAVETQLEGEKLKTVHVGEMWYEPPGAIHLVSRNASQTEPATFLVVFLGEAGKEATTFLH